MSPLWVWTAILLSALLQCEPTRAQCSTTYTPTIARYSNSVTYIRACTSAVVPSGALVVVESGGVASVLTGGFAEIRDGGTAAGAGRFVLDGGTITGLGQGATVTVSPHPGTPVSLPYATSVTITIATATGTDPITLEGDYNSVRFMANPTPAPVVYAGSNNIFMVDGAVTITGNSNTVTYLGKRSEIFTIAGQDNEVTVAARGILTQTADNIKYTVQSGGTIRIFDPTVTGTVYTGAGRLEFLYPHATITNGGLGTAVVSDYGECLATVGNCIGTGNSATVTASAAATGVLVGSGGTLYVDGGGSKYAFGQALLSAQGIPNTVYASGRYAWATVGAGNSEYASASATAQVSSGGTASVTSGRLVVMTGGLGYVGPGAGGVVQAGGTARVETFPVTFTAVKGATIEAVTSTVFLTAVTTSANGVVVYSARARLPSDPVRKRAYMPRETGMASCLYPKILCRGMTGGSRCVDPAQDLANCGGCAFGGIDRKTTQGIDCTDLGIDNIKCRAGRCVEVGA